MKKLIIKYLKERICELESANPMEYSDRIDELETLLHKIKHLKI